MIIIGFEEKNGDQLMVEVIFMGGIWGPYNFGYISTYIHLYSDWNCSPKWGITTRYMCHGQSYIGLMFFFVIPPMGILQNWYIKFPLYMFKYHV
jgi:hypothetical protein